MAKWEGTEAELLAELARFEQERKNQRNAQREANPVIRKFFIERPEKTWTEVYDSTCLIYSLYAKVENKEEALASGHPEHDLREGRINYIFNKNTGLIVCSVGGGTVWVNSGLSGQDSNSVKKTMGAIGRFLIDHPLGGDITDIVEAHRNRKS